MSHKAPDLQSHWSALGLGATRVDSTLSWTCAVPLGAGSFIFCPQRKYIRMHRSKGFYYRYNLESTPIKQNEKEIIHKLQNICFY